MSFQLSANSNQLSDHYQQDGFVVLRNVFSEQELISVRETLVKFHSQWLENNLDLYNSRAINSAYLTDRRLLPARERLILFRLTGDARIAQIVRAIIPDKAAFMNTQLFFNPRKPQQKNYWHRDIQYSGLSVAQQLDALTTNNVVHIRLAVNPEPGLELVPGTHKRWDTDFEFAVRMGRNGSHVYDPLPETRTIPLASGDVLVFSANMIHRGLYGAQRMAFDMLFCDPLPELLQFVNPDCLPTAEEMQAMDCADAFAQTQKVLQLL